MTCSLHVLNSKVHNSVGKIWSALNFIALNLGLPLICSLNRFEADKPI